MNGQMSRYKKSLATTPAPLSLSKCPKLKMDLSGLLKYAKIKGVQPAELSAEEKQRFVK